MRIVRSKGSVISASVLIVASIAVSGCQTTQATAAADCYAETPLPNPVPISKPTGDVPEEYAQFAGIWSNGKWDGKLCHTLVVTAVDADGNAEVIYSHGTYAPWGADVADYYDEWPGTIEDGTLTLADHGSFNDTDVSYVLSDGKLRGSFIRSGESTVTLAKIHPSDDT